jgi:aspartyl/asparaginyl beta-hydroxylase (cupin superfamily)
MKYFFEDKIKNLPICIDLVSNYPKIKEEIVNFCNIENSLVDYPNYKIDGYDAIYHNYWKAAPISIFKNEHTELMGTPEAINYLNSLIANTQKHCPLTYSIIKNAEQKGYLANAFISRLLPGTVINPHVGWSGKYMRTHLGIVCDPMCTITIEDETRSWEEGKLLAFDDGPPYPHSVKHEGTKERIVLSVDLSVEYLVKTLKS